jgi:hypothetical protein
MGSLCTAIRNSMHIAKKHHCSGVPIREAASIFFSRFRILTFRNSGGSVEPNVALITARHGADLASHLSQQRHKNSSEGTYKIGRLTLTEMHL